MIEWIITSCVLIVIVLLLRFALKDRISLGLQYTLWLLVLVRLLVPVNFFSSPMSIMNAVPQPEPAPTVALSQETPEHTDLELPQPQLPQIDYSVPVTQQTPVTPTTAVIPEPEIIPVEKNKPVLSLKQILLGLWVLGMAVCCIVISAANIRFALRLKRSRQKAASDCGLPVYITGIIDTPCLFGLFRPAIYLPNEALTDEEKRHILTHELTHYRHLDHIWALLRSLCLVLHWYNPLVWLAAVLSRRDAELACDEATIRRLGEDSRAEYGKTLIRMTCAKQEFGSILTTATTMTGSKKAITHRIKLIAKHPKTAAFAIICVVLVAAIAVGCTFTGANQPAPEEATQEETTLPTPETLPLDEETMEFWFASGAGAWSSRLILSKDGSFTGNYHNTEPSEVGNNYPNGTRYQSAFDGRFEIVKQLNDYSIELQLTQVQTEQPVDTISFEDGMRIVSASAFGIDGGSRFTLYLPNATKEQIPTEGRSWLRPTVSDLESNKQLGFYFLYNETEETGFYSTIDQTGSNVDTPDLQIDETTLAEYLTQNGLDINAPYLHFTVNYEGKYYHFSSHNDLFMYDWNFLVHSSFKPKEKTGFDDGLDYICIYIEAAYGTTGTIYVNKDGQLRVGEENYYRVPGLYSEIKHRLSFHTEKSDRYYEIEHTTAGCTYKVYGFDTSKMVNRTSYYLYLTDDNYVYAWSQYGTGTMARRAKFYDPASRRVSPTYYGPSDYCQNMVVAYGEDSEGYLDFCTVTVYDIFSGKALFTVNEYETPINRTMFNAVNMVHFNVDGSAIIVQYYDENYDLHWQTISLPTEVRLNRTVTAGKSTKQLPSYKSSMLTQKPWEDPEENPSSNIPVPDQQAAIEIAEAVINAHFTGYKTTAVSFHPKEKVWVVSLSNGSKNLMMAISWQDADILGVWESDTPYVAGTTPWVNAKNLLSEPYISNKETAGLVGEAIRAAISRQAGLYYPHACVQVVYYEESAGYWIIDLYKHAQYPVDAGTFITIDEKDGHIVKMWHYTY